MNKHIWAWNDKSLPSL
jgi:hypothetical protein